MKTSNFFRVALSAMLFMFSGIGTMAIYAQGDKQASTNVNVTIRVADQITIDKTTDLDFGGVFLDKVNPSTVSMDKTGTVTSNNALLYDTDFQQIGGFRVSADKDFTYSLDFSTSLHLLLDGSLSDYLVYNPAVYDNSGNTITPSPTTTRTMSEGGRDEYSVAGSVVIPPTSKPGTYSALFNVIVIWD